MPPVLLINDLTYFHCTLVATTNHFKSSFCNYLLSQTLAYKSEIVTNSASFIT
jgi:hypothetical protein